MGVQQASSLRDRKSTDRPVSSAALLRAMKFQTLPYATASTPESWRNLRIGLCALLTGADLAGQGSVGDKTGRAC
jgi:hypothetical protein